MMNGQNQDDIYIILTSTPPAGNDSEGIFKEIRTGAPERLHNYPPISFRFRSDSKDIRFILDHRNWKNAPLRPFNQMQIVMKDKTFLNDLNPIDFDVIWPTMTKSEAEAFCETIKGKLIWLIDRNDMVGNNVKLIQVQLDVPKLY
jgi:hypothetical protein